MNKKYDHFCDHFCQLRFVARLVVCVASLSGCSVGPDYVRPTLHVPASYKEAMPSDAAWKPAEPRDHAVRSTWWTQFADAQLDVLVAQVIVDNQNVRAAAASHRQALAALGMAQASAWPDAGMSLEANRGKASGSNAVRDTDRIALQASWEPDLWGRIGRGVESAEATAQASAADFHGALLSAQATLVQSYLQLRVLDAQRRLFERTVAEYTRALEITRNRYDAGVAGRSDVVQAEIQLKNAQAQVADLVAQRARLEHAIAMLIGQAPAAFTLEEAASQPKLPEVPPELPSQLLERRPDIAAAERRMAAANAQVGVAQAAYFPTLTLSGVLGYQNDSFAQLVSAPHRYWSLGPGLLLSLFDGGARSAAKKGALAAWDKSMANYRQSVLGALQDVEDNLVSLRLLAEEARLQKQTVEAARELLTLSEHQYLAGMVSYLNVTNAQTTALAAERASLEIHGRRLLASVALLKALGGDWHATSTGQSAVKE